MATALIGVMVVADVVFGAVLIVDARRSRRLEDELVARRARARRLAIPILERRDDVEPPFGDFLIGWSRACWAGMVYFTVTTTADVASAGWTWGRFTRSSLTGFGAAALAGVVALRAERWALRWHDEATPRPPDREASGR